jgi:hypothetical protein
MFRPESWRELAGGSWSRWDLWFCTVAVPGFEGDWARFRAEIVRRSPRALVRSGPDWKAKLSHLQDLHAPLAAVDLDAGQFAGEAAHDLVEALLWSLAAELRGSGWLPRQGRHGPGGLPAGRHR